MSIDKNQLYGMVEKVIKKSVKDQKTLARKLETLMLPLLVALPNKYLDPEMIDVLLAKVCTMLRYHCDLSNDNKVTCKLVIKDFNEDTPVEYTIDVTHKETTHEEVASNIASNADSETVVISDSDDKVVH